MEYGQRKAHPTKKGSGRRHKDGAKHGAAAKPPKGAWAGPHTNPEKNARRAAIKAAGGIRQFKRHRASVRAA